MEKQSTMIQQQNVWLDQSNTEEITPIYVIYVSFACGGIEPKLSLGGARGGPQSTTKLGIRGSVSPHHFDGTSGCCFTSLNILTPGSPYAAHDLCPFEGINFFADGVRKARLPDVH